MKRIVLLAGLILCTSHHLYGQTCAPPNYCADQSTTVKPYPAGPVPTPPALNGSFMDPVFNRPIWRWTDGTISPTGQRAQGISWHAGSFPGSWNQLSNALITNGDDGWATVLKVDTSNPTAPSATSWSCTATSSLCTGGKIKLFNGSIFANTSNHLIYYMGSDQKLNKADFAANYSSPSTAPTITAPWFDPFAAGKCAAAVTPNNGGGQPITTSDDAYFWGFSVSTSNKIIVWHAGDSNCTLIDFATGTWTVSGVGQQGGTTGTITWTDESGNPASGPGAGCTIHSEWYDQVTNTVILQPTFTSCANYPTGATSIRVNLTTLHGYRCLQNFCGTGHGLGFNMHVGGQGYESTFGTYSANTLKLWATPLTLPDTAQSWGANPPDTTGNNYWANHSATLWTTNFPVLGAIYAQDTQENTSPPQANLPTGFTIPYAEEIDLWAIPDATGLNTKYYRFAHTYEADNDYNSGGLYNSAVGPALSPDKCWVAFPSNWYGNLGTTGNRGTTCTVSGNCAYDVFAVYLCGGSSGAVPPPTNLVVKQVN